MTHLRSNIIYSHALYSFLSILIYLIISCNAEDQFHNTKIKLEFFNKTQIKYEFLTVKNIKIHIKFMFC